MEYADPKPYISQPDVIAKSLRHPILSADQELLLTTCIRRRQTVERIREAAVQDGAAPTAAEIARRAIAGLSASDPNWARDCDAILPPEFTRNAEDLHDTQQTPNPPHQSWTSWQLNITQQAADARDSLARHNQRLVAKTAWNYVQFTDHIEDLFQEGNIGLLTAIDRFDPYPGNRFATLAVWWIRARIIRALPSLTRKVAIPSDAYKHVRDAHIVDEQMQNELGYPPSDAQLAHRLGITPIRTRTLRTLFLDNLSIEASSPDGQMPSDTPTVRRNITLPSAPGPENEISQRLAHEDLQAAISQLPSREQDIIVSRFGFNDDPQTLQSIGNRYRITKERVRQLEKHAIASLRTILFDHQAQLYLQDYA